jgi:excisionase family DNA binding protein
MTTNASAAQNEPVIPSEADRLALESLDRQLSADLPEAKLVGPAGEIALPEAVYSVLVRIVHEMAQGNAISVMPLHKQLTTQQSAELLGVSRPYLVRLLEKQALPFTKIGSHRRVLLQDLLNYKAKRDAEREDALDQLAAESEALGLPE